MLGTVVDAEFERDTLASDPSPTRDEAAHEQDAEKDDDREGVDQPQPQRHGSRPRDHHQDTRPSRRSLAWARRTAISSSDVRAASSSASASDRLSSSVRKISSDRIETRSAATDMN